MFVDTHIHLTHKLFNGQSPCIISGDNNEYIKQLNQSELIKEFQKNNIAFCVEPGIDLDSNYNLLKLSDNYPGYIYPTVGIHPTRSPETKWTDRKKVAALMDNEKVIAIGELGLDYHYDRNKQHRLKQKIWFMWQLNEAHKRNLPLVLHIRLADKDAIKILRRYKNKLHGGVCHCFNRGTEEAKIYTEEFGFMLGIGGSILHDENTDLQKAVLQTPLEFLVLETDGPFVKGPKPDSLTGKQWKKARNTSLIIPQVAAKIASIKNIDSNLVEQITTENAKRLYNIK